MNRLFLLLASTALTVSLAGLPVHAQTASEEQVETDIAPASAEQEAARNRPAETAPANAPSQEPAFENQTRAPQPATPVSVDVEAIAKDLPHLWALEFLPDGRMLVTTKQGAMHIITPEGEAGPELDGVPDVDARGQGGLLDVALATDFEESRRIFFSFSEPREGGNGTSVASATLSPDDKNGGSLEDVEVIFRQTPAWRNTKHFGSRVVPTNDGHLYITVGERSDRKPRVQAQELDSGLGKVFRIKTNGEPAEDNPFVGRDDARPEIWSYGHRNVQSAALDGEGRLWLAEHGPKGGDELNQPEAGKNYGWPVITYGVEYSGGAVGEGITAKEGMEQPVYYWDPVIGPSGMAFYEGDEFPEWTDSLLIGGLVTNGIVVLTLDEGRVASEERIPLEARIRDVRVGPDGAVYAVTEDRRAGKSSILRLTKAAN